MAQLPNTQYVAHEFVRQYYTMLHKDPSQLHRFYTRESRLTHGVSPNARSEDPVCGQEAINDKISQLHFRNCHAKIRSVDSHPTIGGGVVIQVTGELSNAGMAMRKFMQTFVLAQQEPKKYNVFNDIFRYQDETFEDTENDETVDGTVESENSYAIHEQPAVVPQPDIIAEMKNEIPHVDSLASTTPLVNGGDQYDKTLYSDAEKPLLETPHDATENDEDNDEEDESSDVQELAEESEEFSTPAQTPMEAPIEDIVQPDSDTRDEKVEDDGTEFKEYTDSMKDDEVISEEVKQPIQAEVEDATPKTFTWAALAKKNTPVSATAAPIPTQVVAPKQTSKKPDPPQQQQGPPQKKREEASTRKEMPEEPRRKVPDSHQIFIGNLPNNITEKDVREAFKEFGNIVEVRLNPKNFGFVAFDGPDPPNKILGTRMTRSTVILGNTINTEVKRSVSGSGRGGAGSGSGGGGGFRRDRERDSSARSRNEANKNASRSNSGGQNRAGKSSSYSQKQQRHNDDNKNKDSKPTKERQTRR